MADDLKGIWITLREIKDELKDFDNKWEDHIQNAAADREKINTLCKQVDHIDKLLTRGNGQRPLITQIDGLTRDVSALKEAQEASDNLEEAEEGTKKAKWSAVAKIATAIVIMLPGILVLMGVRG